MYMGFPWKESDYCSVYSACETVFFNLLESLEGFIFCMKKLLLLSVSLALTTMIWAQDRIVTGKVISVEDGIGIPGVNVLVQGTTQGTVTDVDGNYSLNVPSEGANLVFSFVGYRSQVIVVGNQSIINIQLEEDITALDEIVVTAFGMER